MYGKFCIRKEPVFRRKLSVTTFFELADSFLFRLGLFLLVVST